MTEEPTTTPPPEAPPADATGTGRNGRRRRGGAQAKTRPPAAAVPEKRAPQPVHPVLEQLAGLYPQLFGANFLPLKRGIFHDLMAAHTELLDKDSLKEALARHTRSTRYLIAVASGQQRHDLMGQPVEAMAPEHVHHALLEVFRRRQGRAGASEDLRPRLVARILQALDASGLSREDYAALVRGRDEDANALLDMALAEAAARAARDEALLRAYSGSGQTSVSAFADMYGMDPRAAAASLERARRGVADAAPATGA